MCRILHEIKREDGLLTNSPPVSPSFSISTPYNTFNYEKESSPSLSAFDRVSPVLLLVIIILAVIFFVSGLVHLLVRCLMKRTPFSPIFHSNRYPETSGSHSLQRQLQQLFRLHDSGLDQAFVEALPVFYYKDIMGLKEPFDCAVCLCEFAGQDKLKLLPICSHAFHIHCIDTWLLSNSTCPLCRGTLLSSTLPAETPWLNLDTSREATSNRLTIDEENVSSHDQRPEKRVLSVRLGKFRTFNNGETSVGEETSRCNLDARRCYSMGTVQYVVGDSNLQVALCGSNKNIRENNNECSVVDGDMEGRKIRGRSRGDSFSVSKIWLWTKKSRMPSYSSSGIDVSSFSSSLTGSLSINADKIEVVRDV